MANKNALSNGIMFVWQSVILNCQCALGKAVTLYFLCKTKKIMKGCKWVYHKSQTLTEYEAVWQYLILCSWRTNYKEKYFSKNIVNT